MFSQRKKQRGGKRKPRKNKRSTRTMVEQAPVTIGFTNRSSAPKVTGNGSTKTVVHRELIATIAGGTGLSVIVSDLNPGLFLTFPWLSNEALTYEMYRWNYLEFDYEPSTSTSSKGTVMIAIDFDADDAPPTTENEIMNHTDAVAGPSWANIKYITSTINFNRQFPNKFVRLGELDTQKVDVHAYDLGKLLIATIGQSDTTVIGRIYVSYSVTFMIPALPTQGERGTYALDFWSNSLTSATNYFGIAGSFDYPPYQNGNLTVQAVGKQLWIIGTQPGEVYLVIWRVSAATITGTPSQTGTGYVNVATLTQFGANIGSTELMWMFFIKSISTSALITIANVTALSGVTNNCIYVSALSGSTLFPQLSIDSFDEEVKQKDTNNDNYTEEIIVRGDDYTLIKKYREFDKDLKTCRD